MKMKTSCFLSAAVLLLLGQAVWSAPVYTSKELLEACQAYASADGDKAKAEACAGFIRGVIGLHDMLVIKGTIAEQWCAPKDVTLDQLIKVALDFMVTRPEKLDSDAAIMVSNAFYKDFHCH